MPGRASLSCRVKSNPKNAVNETFLAGFLDFVIWGHEHECLVEPQVLADASQSTYNEVDLQAS